MFGYAAIDVYMPAIDLFNIVMMDQTHYSDIL